MALGEIRRSLRYRSWKGSNNQTIKHTRTARCSLRHLRVPFSSLLFSFLFFCSHLALLVGRKRAGVDAAEQVPVQQVAVHAVLGRCVHQGRPVCVAKTAAQWDRHGRQHKVRYEQHNKMPRPCVLEGSSWYVSLSVSASLSLFLSVSLSSSICVLLSLYTSLSHTQQEPSPIINITADLPAPVSHPNRRALHSSSKAARKSWKEPRLKNVRATSPSTSTSPGRFEAHSHLKQNLRRLCWIK